MFELDLNREFSNEYITYKNNKLVFCRSNNEPLLLKRFNQNLDIEVLDGVSATLIELYSINDGFKYQDKIINNGYLNHQKILQGEADIFNYDFEVSNKGNNYTLTLLDLSVGSLKGNVSIDTLNHHGESYIYFASLCGKGEKVINNQIVNRNASTIGIMENYGVAFKDGLLDIIGVGDIKHGCVQSTNRQKSNLIIMDETAKAISRPYLYIDENDVTASHASAVGEISQEQLFYLLSRGIGEEAARRMIILGYFQPVVNKINDDKIREEIANYIEEVIFDD